MTHELGISDCGLCGTMDSSNQYSNPLTCVTRDSRTINALSKRLLLLFGLLVRLRFGHLSRRVVRPGTEL